MLDEMNGIYMGTLQAQRSKTPKKNLDKEAFLKLLVTQLQNQDPTNSMDTKDMLAQMSQLSTTEQIMNMSTSFQNMIDSQMNMNKMQAASIVGKNVVVENNVVNLSDGRSENIYFSVDKESPIVVEIYDSNDKVIKREDLGIKSAGGYPYLWDGKDNSGVSMADGSYKIKVFSYLNGQKTEISPIDGGKAQAVQFLDKKYYVIVNNKKYPISSIKEISEDA